jgi:hypothetical protein
MKNLLSLGAVVLFLGTSLSGNQDRNGSNSAKDRFVGAWRLVSLEAPDPDGNIRMAASTVLRAYTVISPG